VKRANYVISIIFLASMSFFNYGCKENVFLGRRIITDSISIDLYRNYGIGVYGGSVVEYRVVKLSFQPLKTLVLDDDHQKFDCKIIGDTLQVYSIDRNSQQKLDSMIVILRNLKPNKVND